MSVRRILLLALLAGLLVIAAVPASADTGQIRVLVAKLTWGPQPFTDADVTAAVTPVPAFYATASFGKVSLSFGETPWLTLLPSPNVCASDPYAAAFSGAVHGLLADAGYPASSYDRLVVLIPDEGDCRFNGITQGSVTVLNGILSTAIVTHELGHSFGMGHAGAFTCHYTTFYETSGRRFCKSDPYGDPWDVMGAQWQTPQFGDFGALQKIRASWITSYVYVSKPGVYQLAPFEETSTLPQALIIHAGAFEYWIDHREAVGNDAYLAATVPDDPVTGFEVHRITGNPLAVPNDHVIIPEYLIPTGPTNRYTTPVGSTFTVPGVFALGTVTRTNGVMTVRFRWIDKTKPTAPKIVRISGTTVTFRSSTDRGSGIDHYLVSVDGQAVQTVLGPSLPPAIPNAPKSEATETAILPTLAHGKHTLTIVAIDAAGNRSAAATLSVWGG